ncbi:MAG: AMP-binding protein [Victivallaceae bacterium]|nr:AMP-binding protein [Victivallaceae bacterium]
MLVSFLSLIVKLLLKLRYRIQVYGLEKIKIEQGRGILFLPNHPALIDPEILGSFLIRKFRPWILIDDKQVAETPLKHFIRSLRLLPFADLGVVGDAGVEKCKAQFETCRRALQKGENVLMYPSGRVYRSRYENLQGNTGAYTLLRQCPGVRVVLIRTRGLWGSSFSRSCGKAVSFSAVCRENLKKLFWNFFFFMPRRDVEITLEEVSGLSRFESKEVLNRYLENFYNQNAPANMYVPYKFWEKGGTRTVAEPPSEFSEADTSDVPDPVRQKIYARLREVSSVAVIRDQDKLGKDLGMDSLLIYGMAVWTEQEFAVRIPDPGSLRLVGDLLLAAIGKTPQEKPLQKIPVSWFIPPDATAPEIPENSTTITGAFLRLAKQRPDFPLLADQSAGVLTNRKIILAILALKDGIAAIPGEKIGLVMPACAAFFPVYMAMLFAGKTPVMLNWTVGARTLAACVRKSGLQYVLTSQLVVRKLTERGTDLSPVSDRFVFLEDLKQKITVFKKLRAWFFSRFSWQTLRAAKVSPYAAILFTSGSESEPKAVPVTHENELKDIQYAMEPMKLRRDDSILGMLPPFHAFGLLINGVLPAISNMRIVYHGDPTDGNMLKRLICAYRTTMIVGTPTFVEGILKHALREEVETVRIVITGAEKCSSGRLELFREKCPDAYFLEGYGITECGPIIAVNQPDARKNGTVGRILKCLDWMICDENGDPLPSGKTGMLYVSGPTVFPGYLSAEDHSPFVEMKGKMWYRTGDLVEADDENFITFKGRLKRFVKIAGEMVSLPAVEEALLSRFGSDAEKTPLAVEAQGSDDKPEIILFATLEITREAANQALREAGFSPISYVGKVVRLDEIPLLGTGKTDYRKLKTLSA